MHAAFFDVVCLVLASLTFAELGAIMMRLSNEKNYRLNAYPFFEFKRRV